MKLNKSIIENPNNISPTIYKGYLQELLNCAIDNTDVNQDTMTTVVKYLLDKQAKNKVKTFKDDEQWLNSAVSKDETRKALTLILNDSTNKCHVATDGYRLHMVKDSDITETTTTHPVYKHEVNDIHYPYPKWEKVVPSSSSMEAVKIVDKTCVYQGSLKIYKITFCNNTVKYLTASYFDTIDNYLSKFNVHYYISPNNEFSPILFETSLHKAILMPIRYRGN